MGVGANARLTKYKNDYRERALGETMYARGLGPGLCALHP